MKPILTVKHVPCSFVRGVDAFEHVAQPGARFRAVGKLDEDMTPVSHQDRRYDVVLNVVEIVLQVSGSQGLHRRESEHCHNPQNQSTCRDIEVRVGPKGCSRPISGAGELRRHYAAFFFFTPNRSGTSVNCHSLATSVSMAAPLRTNS